MKTFDMPAKDLKGLDEQDDSPSEVFVDFQKVKDDQESAKDSTDAFMEGIMNVKSLTN